MAPVKDNRRAATIMTLSMAGYALSDTCVKALGAQLPLGQTLFLRSVLMSVLIGGYVIWRGQWRVRLSGRDRGRVALRTAGEIIASFFFISALFNMPLANATAILQALPLSVTLGAALFFGEPIGWRRMLAILVGFVGVMLIVRPGAEGFNVYTLYALTAVAAITLRDLATRRLDGSVPTMMVVLASSVGVMGLGAVLGAGEVWVMPDAVGVGLLGLSALFIILAYATSVIVMQIGDIAAVSPFRYTGLLWATLLGYVVFAEFPTPLTLLGAGIVVASGVFTVYRTRRVAPPG